jgi:predicted transcriptional regulator
MAKMTFSLDDETVRTLRAVAERKQKPQSVVVREAIVEYAAKDEKLSDTERARKLQLIRGLKSQPATRDHASVDRELDDLRHSRKAGWSRPSD